MASASATPPESSDNARAWERAYCAADSGVDALCAATGASRAAWSTMIEELAGAAPTLDQARERAQRHADDIGTGYRIPGEREERPWPLSPVPLMIDRDDWRQVEAGIVERAELMETVLADLYGPATLMADGALPAALATGSPYFLRAMAGMSPPGGRHLHFYAADLARDPDGGWRVLADHLRSPAGAGYALENRLAIARTISGLQLRLNIERHAPFFAAMREGLAASCRRTDPRIGLLTPGRFNPSYAEQAHLARYLGFLLVEGADLAAIDGKVYVRTIAGLKRIDALWRRIDPQFLDPLVFDSASQIGVAGLVDAMAAGNVVIANAPGVGVLEAPAFMAFLPQLARRMLGRPLTLPNIATWWCGDPAAADDMLAHLDERLIGPAFGPAPLGLPGAEPVMGASLGRSERAALAADLKRRPQDYAGREVVRLSTMPVVIEGALAARPFTLRVFAARGADGQWVVMPGGLARIGTGPDTRAAVMGEGSWSADVCVHGPDPVPAISLLPTAGAIEIRRNPGTLPSRVADNLFWLGRYLERGEALLGVIRVLLGHSISADTGAALAADTVTRLVDLIRAAGAATAPPTRSRTDLAEFAEAALDGHRGWYGVRAIIGQARTIGSVSRERLSADMIRLLDAPFPQGGTLLDRAGSLQRRYAAMAGLAAEHMARTDAWRFHDLGRRIERAATILRIVSAFMAEDASGDDLSTLLDLADSQISYRQRYLGAIARRPILDLVLLDPGNPRSLAFQTATILDHLRRLPVLSDHGLAEPQQALAEALQAAVQIARVEQIDAGTLDDWANQVGQVSDAIARRYFLHGAEPLRAGGLTLA